MWQYHDYGLPHAYVSKMRECLKATMCIANEAIVVNGK